MFHHSALKKYFLRQMVLFSEILNMKFEMIPLYNMKYCYILFYFMKRHNRKIMNVKNLLPLVLGFRSFAPRIPPRAVTDQSLIFREAFNPFTIVSGRTLTV